MLTVALCKIKKLSQRQSSILQKLLGALHIQLAVQHWTEQKERDSMYVVYLELVSKELNHLVAILHVYAGGLKFMK